MARKRNPQEKKPTDQGKKRSSGQKTSAPLKRHRPQDEPEEVQGLLDDSAKRDIAGISFIILAIVFLLLVIIPTDGAIVDNAASEWMRLIFGVGAYMLPVVLAGIGFTFLYKPQRQQVPARAAIGLGILFLSLLGLIAAFTPVQSLGQTDLGLLFLDSNLSSHGGYIGAGIAWCGLSLFGQVITAVILIGIMIIGCVIIGFSVSKTIELIRAKKRFLESRRADSDSSSLGSRRLRVRKAEDVQMRQGMQEMVPQEMPGANVDQLRYLEPSSETRQLGVAAAGLDAPEQASPAARRIAYAKEALGGYPQAQAASDAQVTRPLVEPVVHEAVREVPADQPQEVFMPLENLTQRLDMSEEEAFEEEELPEERVRLKDWQPKDARRSDIPSISLPFDEDEPKASTSVNLEDLASALPSIGGGVALNLEESVPVGGATIKMEDAKGEAKAPAPKKAKSTPKKEPASKASSGKARADEAPAVIRDGFQLPAMSLLQAPDPSHSRGSDPQVLQLTSEKLQATLESFGVNAKVVGWIEGPTVTLFKVDLPSGVRVSRITNLSDDIALALASPGVRIFAPIPGTNHVGIEIPNAKRQTVFLSEVLNDAKGGALEVAIGKDVEGRSIISDLAKMPHLLIGGTTGSGKSVAINAMIMSILMRSTPDEVRFIMVDPKRVEFTPYNGIPHLYVPVVTEPKEAANALSWGVAEMERRLKVFSKQEVAVRNISQYNQKVKGGGVFDAEGRELDPMPYIVIIIDELADLMMNVGKEVEFSISRIAQLARAAGIHLIVATQRPSTNVVTGLIKANITNRIAFNVASGIDSRVILDTPGAENLIGLGDMLLSKPELPKPQRIQACYVSEEEIAAVVDHVKSQGEPEYHADILQVNHMSIGDTSPQGGSGSVDDPLVWDAADIVVSSRMGSTSNIQRRLKVGYARAGRIMDQLEEMGVVGPANGSKPREVLVDALELETLKAFEQSDAS